jgi:hypothetical protein
MVSDCIRSVLDNPPADPYELIVVDNASTDGSAHALRERFADRITLIPSDHNLGFAGGNNLGFPHCRGRHILLLNSDTLVLRDVLQRTIDFLDDNPSVGAMGCRVLNTDRTLQRTCSREPGFLNFLIMTLALDELHPASLFGRYEYRDWNRDTQRDVGVVSGCYLAIPRNVFQRVGPLDDSFFFFGEETDWCRRIADAGYRLVLAPVGEIIHHGGGSVKKLNHKRDVMLTEGIVRFKRKHDGPAAAAALWALLFAFNASRCLGHALLSPIRKPSRARAKHFALVVRNFHATWPTPPKPTPDDDAGVTQ